jgi:hypothetical protein
MLHSFLLLKDIFKGKYLKPNFWDFHFKGDEDLIKDNLSSLEDRRRIQTLIEDKRDKSSLYNMLNICW